MRKRLAKTALASAAFLTLALGAAGKADAEAFTYTIDPAQSFLTVTGNLGSNPANQQTSGSLTTSYSGTILAERGSGTITFPGGSSVDAALQPVSQSPASDDGSGGTAPADYGRSGVVSLTSVGPDVDATEALRGFNFDFESDGPVFLSGTNTFNGNTFGTVVNSGDSYWQYGNTGGTYNFFDDFSFNSNVSPSSVTLNGNVETLTLNIGANYGYTVAQPGDSLARFSGQIVATRLVPEPSAIGAAGLAAALALSRRGRRSA